MDANDFKNNYPDYDDQVEHVEQVPPERADSVPKHNVFDNSFAGKIPFDELYSHQAKSLELLDQGHNVCVTTPTSSGKTLIYALHIAREYKRNPDSTALLVYPTKALSRDQYTEISSIYDEMGLNIDIGVYDGDTSSSKKRQIRRESDLVITNFQGLNYYLPYHKKWNRIFENLSTVVIDEAHTYTGLHGIHVSWIVRRMLRIINGEYGSQPSIVLSSATIGNPREHSKNLTGEEFKIVDSDGSPSGKRDIVLWNPPSYMDDGQLERRSPHRESSDVLSYLCSEGMKTLMFAPSRKMTELCAKWSEDTLKNDYAGFYDIEPYNAGHMKDDRREVEDNLKDGSIDGVVSTTALELGIDIGDVDATVMDGYPGKRASFWQQAGRSGRGTKDALSILVTRHDSIDQYIVKNPGFLLEEDVENAVIDLGNVHILEMHLCAAANEAPLSTYSLQYFGDGPIEDALDNLRNKGLIDGEISDIVTYTGPERPESNIDIYSTSDEQFDVYIDAGNEKYDLPPVDKARAFRDFHPNAIYMYKGNQYEVTEFDTDKREILLEYTEVDYYTQSGREVSINNIVYEESKEIADGITIKKGTGEISESYKTYTRVYLDGTGRESNIPTGLNEPVSLETDIMWIELDDNISQEVTTESTVDGLAGSLHAAEHALIKMSPTILTADTEDLGGLSTPVHDSNGKSTVFIYDGVEGGVGFSHKIYDELEDLSVRTENLLKNCDCESDHGCPACTMSPMCGDNNEPMDSIGAQHLLSLISR